MNLLRELVIAGEVCGLQQERAGKICDAIDAAMITHHFSQQRINRGGVAGIRRRGADARQCVQRREPFGAAACRNNSVASLEEAVTERGADAAGSAEDDMNARLR